VGNLEVVDIPIKDVQPNAWNPNRQTDRQFEAEVESILANGFILPTIVRKVKSGYEIVDGEHRWRALNRIMDEGLQGKGNLAKIVSEGVMPSVILDISEAQAKKLTIILNETRGRANIGELSQLLAELDQAFGSDLITGLPYTDTQLNEFVEMGKFDWSELDSVSDLPSVDLDSGQPDDHTVIAMMDEETFKAWKSLMAENKGVLPADAKYAAGALIKKLLMIGGEDG
jgi:hypothetical protein